MARKRPPVPPLPNRAASAVQQHSKKTAARIATQPRSGVGERPASVVGREIAAAQRKEAELKKQQTQTKTKTPPKTPEH